MLDPGELGSEQSICIGGWGLELLISPEADCGHLHNIVGPFEQLKLCVDCTDNEDRLKYYSTPNNRQKNFREWGPSRPSEACDFVF